MPTRSSLEGTKNPESGWITVQGSSQGNFISRNSEVGSPNEIAETNVTNVEVDNSEMVQELGEDITLMNIANRIMEIPVITDIRSLSPDSQIKISRNIAQTVTQDVPQLINSPGKRYASKKEILPADTSSSPGVEKTDEDHCVNKYQSPILTLEKIAPAQNQAGSIQTDDRICRLCLRYSKENLTPFFCGGRAKPYLVCFLKECCSLEVSQDDPMPKSICGDCRNKLIRAYDFRNQCHKSDNVLRECYKLPPRNDCSQADKCVVEKEDKAIQVECFDYSDRIMALQSLETENIEDEDSADDPRTMDIVGKINHANVDIDEYSVSHFYESVAQEVSNSIENTDDEPPGEAEVELESFGNQEPLLDEINDINVDDENSVSYFYEVLDQEVCNAIKNSEGNTPGEVELEFESLETQEPHLGEVNDVNVDMDEDSVSHFYEFLDQEVSKDIENSEDNTPGEGEVEFESCEEQEPDLDKVNDLNEEIDEDSMSLFYEPFDPEDSNDIENSEDNTPGGAEVEFESCEEQEPHLGKTKDVNEGIDENSASSEEANEIENESFKEQKPHQKEKSKKLKNETFRCNKCPSVFKTKDFLERHIKNHLTIQTYTCDTCSRDFSTKGSLTLHVRIHDEGKRFKCDVCGLKYAHRYLLNSHLRLHGKGKPFTKEKKFLCEVCNKSFVSQSGLKHHENLHTDAKHKCKFCDKTFKQEIYKKKHEVRHRNIKFKCHLCPKIYSSDNGLKHHILKHTGETRYHCDICGKSFSRRRNLNEHTNTHTGKKPYVCKVCGVAYGNSGSLFAHQRRCKPNDND